jgi:hypothetical protein
MGGKNTRKTVINEELSEKQQKMYDEWLSHIKAIYGEYGLFTWKITPNGIGSGIVVYSHKTRTELDLTDTIQRTILQINKQGRGTTPAGGLSGGT